MIVLSVEAGLLHASQARVPYLENTVVGATFPFAPVGTLVSSITVQVPEGVHAICLKETGAVVDKECMHLVLFWWKDGKCYYTEDARMSAAYCLQFNPFIRSAASLMVMHPEQPLFYLTNPDAIKNDTSWQYRLVDVNAMLQYICKHISLEELHATAEIHEAKSSELAELRDKNTELCREIAEQEEHIKEANRKLNVYNRKICTMHEELETERGKLQTAQEAHKAIYKGVRHLIDEYERSGRPWASRKGLIMALSEITRGSLQEEDPRPQEAT